MSGIYILKCCDGYRVAYSNEYDCLFGSFNDDKLRFDLNSTYLFRIFDTCNVFADEDAAIRSAKAISRFNDETDDGIMVIKEYSDYTFKELLDGKANSKREN